jgi:hypothetical protein
LKDNNMKNWLKSLFANPTSLRAAAALGLGISTIFVDPATADKIKAAMVLVGIDGLRVAANAKDVPPNDKQ